MSEIVTKAKPRSIQSPSLFLTRSLFRFADPTGFSPDQWRLIAREPVNKMAQRFIIRELCSLTWEITSDKRNDKRVEDYTKDWNDLWEDGDGFTTWLARMIEDACTLPFGGAAEVGYRGDDLEWALHVDGATLLPTYEKSSPYVQVNPDDWTQRVYFKPGQLQRLRVNPRPDIRFKAYQVAPTEDAFMPIEALSKIYLYYMQELTDTPPMGILDIIGMDGIEAAAWGKNFREMVEGTDPIKIPLLYGGGRTVPANWIPFGRSPADLSIPEQFKRFAEMLLAKYGLSIGDLRLFEHESTKAGEKVSQLVTERSGIGFWAALIAGFIDQLLPDGLTFGFKQPRPERELTVANRKAVQLRMLQEATGTKALISVKDAIEEARALELFTTEVLPLDEEKEPIPPTPSNGGPPLSELEQPGDRPEEELEAEADQDLTKALVMKALGPGWRHPEPPTIARLEKLFRGAFEGAGRAVDAGQVGDVMAVIEEACEVLDVEAEPEEEPPMRITTTGPSGKGEVEQEFKTLDDYLAEQLQDPDFRSEWESQEPEEAENDDSEEI